MTGDELIPVEYDGKNYNINTRDIFNNVSDYNVSVLFPNDGINGDNKYDLEQACKILKPYFDNQNAKHGFIISFYNSDNIIEKWLFCKDNIAPKNFMKINTYENPNNYIGVLKKGVYPNKYVIFKGKQFAGQIGELKTEVAVLKATRPYQDALIQCDIRRVAEHADFNLWRRTCRMISGEVVLPNTPTVTGYASYNPCDCRNNSTQTPAA